MDDPRLKKYKGMFRERQLNSERSTLSLPVYVPNDYKVENNPQNLNSKDEMNTYTYEEDSDGEVKKSKISLIYCMYHKFEIQIFANFSFTFRSRTFVALICNGLLLRRYFGGIFNLVLFRK